MEEKRQYRNRATIGQMIEELSFVVSVDRMLLEGAKLRNVAIYIQNEQQELTEIKESTLVTALRGRRAMLVRDCDDDDDEQLPEIVPEPALPTQVLRSLSGKDGSLNEVIELEVMYLTARDRIERMLQAEHKAGLFSEKMANEFKMAADMLAKRFEMRDRLGLVGRSGSIDARVSLDGYSKETSKTMNHPESRRRIVSLVDRLRKVGKLPKSLESGDEEETKAEG